MAAERRASAAASKAEKSLAAKADAPLAAKAVPKALPAPPKVLALPAPGPGLPPHAAKPRGGQFWVDKELGGSNWSPEEAARQAALGLQLSRFVPEREGVIRTGPQTSTTPASEWLEKALAKYYRTDFGAPDDPLRDLAARGLHYDPEMTPERWQQTVNDYLMEDNIGDMTLPRSLWASADDTSYPGAGDDFTASVRTSMPWLAKQPVTDKLYGISRGGLDLGHFTDEFLNALNDPEAVGLPSDFAVRPESLQRMSFPQAVEHVGRINQWRAKEMERTALSNLDSPAVWTHKTYDENNPRGLRWVELKTPSNNAISTEGWTLQPRTVQGFKEVHIVNPEGRTVEIFDNEPGDEGVEKAQEALKRRVMSSELGKALKYEGDTMGHCVGGYCPDVMEGRSRIFSLRDAKGEPHVTIETKPGMRGIDAWEDEVLNRDHPEIMALVPDFLADPERGNSYAGWLERRRPDVVSRNAAAFERPENIVQIKGKQNRAPVDDYLPFVQDFVKSGQWGNVGDLGNTGLVKLPDGRYITKQQYEGAAREYVSGFPNVSQDTLNRAVQYPNDMFSSEWENMRPLFEGFAYGGRVDADRCFSYNPLSVRRRAA